MKKIWRRINNKYVTFFLITCLLILMEMFHSKLGLYYDDYGNASLSYGYDAMVSGLNWNMGDLWRWAKWIYTNFSGRILCGSILNILVKLGNGPRMFMAIQAVIVVGMFWAMYHIVIYFTKQKANIILLVLMVALFFQMPMDMYRWNLCWASASVLYIWPLFPMFLLFYLQHKSEQNREMNHAKRMCMNAVMVICVLITSFSHEQTGLSMVVYTSIYCVYQWMDAQKLSLKNLLLAVLSLISYAFLFFAPGNWSRMEGNTAFSEKSLLEKIIFNFDDILNLIFKREFLQAYLAITIILVILAYWKYKESGNNKKELLLDSIAMVFLLLILVFNWMRVHSLCVVLEFVYLVTVFVGILLYNFRKERNSLTILLLASAASAFCVLISPTLPLRCFTEWILVIHIVLMILIYDIWEKRGKFLNTKLKKVFYLLCILLSIRICANGTWKFANLYIGYSSNEENMIQNEKILKNYNGENTVYLFQLLNSSYASGMPYEEGFEFIEYWIKQYYDIPQNVQLTWVKNKRERMDLIDTEKKLIKEGEFYDDGWFGENGKIIIEDCKIDRMELVCTVPENTSSNQSIIIESNGSSDEIQLNQGENIIPLNLENNKDNIIKLYAPYATRMSEADERKISFLITYRLMCEEVN